MSSKNRLGKGLESLIPTDIDELLHTSTAQELKSGETKVSLLATASITPNPHQPRAHFDADALKELADSIKTHGILQPLVVVENGKGYQLIAGERRLRAAKLLGLKEVPAIVRTFEAQAQLELALIENIQRAELSPLEQAAAYAKLIDSFSLTVDQIAERVGKAKTTVANIIRLLNLTPEAKAALQQGKITEGHARSLLAFTDPATQLQVLELIIKRDLTVRQAEDLARNFKKDATVDEAKVESLTKEESLFADTIAKAYNTKVSIQKTSRGGRVVIEYNSKSQLSQIVDRMLKS